MSFNFISRSGNKSSVSDDGQGIVQASGLRFSLDSDINYSKGDIIEHNNALLMANSDISSTVNTVTVGTDSDQWTIISGVGSRPDPAFQYYLNENSYLAQDVVLKDGALWIANSDIPAGTTFIGGGYPLQWSMLMTSISREAEFITAETNKNNIDETITSSNGWQAIGTDSGQVLSVTALTDGLFRVSAQAYMYLSSSNTVYVGFSINGADPITENATNVMYSTATGEYFIFDRLIYLNSGDTVTYYARTSGGTLTIVNDPTRYPVLSAHRLGDYTSLADSDDDFISVVQTSSQAISTGDYVKNLSVFNRSGDYEVGGVDADTIRLKGGSTYRLVASLAFTSMTGETIFEFCDSDDNAIPGGRGSNIAGGDAGTSSSTPKIDVIYKPMVDTNIKLKIISTQAGTVIDETYTVLSVIKISEKINIPEQYGVSVWKTMATTQQTLIAGTTPILFDEEILNYTSNVSDISYDNATGTFTLTAGKFYDISATVTAVDSENDSDVREYIFALYDVDNNVFLTESVQVIRSLRIDSDDVWRGSNLIQQYIDCNTSARSFQIRLLKGTNGSVTITPDSDYATWVSVITAGAGLKMNTANRLIDLDEIDYEMDSDSLAGSIDRGAILAHDGSQFAQNTFNKKQTKATGNTAQGLGSFTDEFYPEFYVSRNGGSSSYDDALKLHTSGGSVASYQWFDTTAMRFRLARTVQDPIERRYTYSNIVDTQYLDVFRYAAYLDQMREGDVILGKVLVAKSQDDYIAGDYLDYRFTFVAGPWDSDYSLNQNNLDVYKSFIWIQRVH